MALSLPEDDESGIREKVFDEIKLEELTAEDGFEKLVEFLEKKLGKDDLSDSLEKFEAFENYQRETATPIAEYIAKFDQKYKKLLKHDMALPAPILGFKLLQRANISKSERMLVLTGMDYSKKDDLYEQAKQSLLKFKGEQGGGAGSFQTGGANCAVKLEPAFLAEHEQTLLASGYTKTPRGGYGGRYNYRNTNSRSTHAWRGTRGQFSGPGNSNQHTRGSPSLRNKSRNINPSGTDGNLLLCRACGSYRHLLKDCPDSWENMENVHLVQHENNQNRTIGEEVTLLTGHHQDSLGQLQIDARNCAVLDSACTSTVCGSAWMECYLDSLPPEDRRCVTAKTGSKTFKFGGGEILQSRASYSIPAVLAGQKVSIVTDVVESEIPLLLSKDTMKKAKVKLDLEKDAAEILGVKVPLNLTASGHYCVPIDKAACLPVDVFAVEVRSADPVEQRKILWKLHKQFAHPTESKLKALMMDAGVWTNSMADLLSDICEKCDLCKVHRRTPPRPAVALPMASNFNEKIAMDLKKWDEKWILHLIDMWSRFSVSVLISRKKSSEVIDNVMKHWIGVFGVMETILTDNGGEFNSDEMREVASVLNIEILTTAAESPFQNGLCERNHAVVDNMLHKLKEQHPKTDLQVLLCWANMAKNSLQMCHGFSSHQLVFGQNPNLPNVLTDRPPAIQGMTTSEVLSKHLNALHSARRSFIESEACERVRRALRCKMRASEEKYDHGDRVYYKRESQERWMGPAKVVFQDGKVVFIRHGGVFVRVSPNRLMKVGREFTTDQMTSDEKTFHDKESDNVIKVSPTIVQEEMSLSTPITVEDNQPCDDEPQNTLNSTHVKLVKGDKINFRSVGEKDWIAGTVLGRAGKVSGKNKNWFNIEKISGNQISVNLDELDWQKRTEDVNVVLIPKHRHRENECVQAKQEELQKLQKFKVYEEVEDKGQSLISTRWVLVDKGDKIKARLVARGFEEEFDCQCDSPTIGKSAVRVFLTIVASFKWAVKTTDIKSAYLQGMELKRDVYLIPPVEANVQTGKIWKLKHCLYGLNDGARQFYLSVREHLLKIGCIQSSLDPALFFYRVKGKLIGLICCHIDDFLHAGECEFDRQVMENLTERFLAGKVEEKTFKYIGFQVIQQEHGIVLDHSQYTSDLENGYICPKRAAQKHSKLNSKELTTLRQLVGRLNWAVQGSRPDMAFDMIELSTKLNEGMVEDLLHAIKVVGRLKEVESRLYFPVVSLIKEETRLILFTDAAHANICHGVGSVGAYIAFLVDNNQRCCPLIWQACKIKRVVRSTIAAETLSLQEGLEAVYYIQRLLLEILDMPVGSIPIVAFVDNKSVVQSIHSTSLVDDKRLRLDIAAIKQSIDKHEVSAINWCPSKAQLANCMTKRGASAYELLTVLHQGKINNVN